MAVIAIVGAVYTKTEQNKATREMLDVQQKEIDASAATQKQQRMEEARALRATARAAAAESAVSGNSVDAIAVDIMGQAGRDVSLIETNRRNGTLASGAEAAARMRVANADMINSIGSTAVSSYNNYTIKKNGPGGT